MHTDGIHLHYIVFSGFDLLTDIRTCWAASSQPKIYELDTIEVQLIHVLIPEMSRLDTKSDKKTRET